jgi:hypothetical protein
VVVVVVELVGAGLVVVVDGAVVVVEEEDVTGTEPAVVGTDVVVVPDSPSESNNRAIPQAAATITAATMNQRTKELDNSR